MRKNVRAAMDALFAGKEYTNPSIQTRQTGDLFTTVGECGFYLPTVYSYGSHYPLVMLTPERNEAYLNTTRYSATTSSQQAGAATYLHYEGYRDTGDTIIHRGHTYAIYRKDEPESWPNYSTTSVYRRPNHHNQEGS
jgi:hypothetical protein